MKTLPWVAGVNSLITVLENYRDSIFETFFGNVDHCIVIVDHQGNISYMNESYIQFLDVGKEEIIGRHVTEVIENTRMHLVVESGKEEMADLQHIRGQYMIANRIPLRSDGQVVGALGMVLFRDTEEWEIMNTHIKDLLFELETYRNRSSSRTGARYSLHDIVSSSEEIHDVKDKIKKIAHADIPVLIRGESGTGKELFAHSIHQLSDRSDQPFVKVNCAAIPEHLIESELFGYLDGAFTGAKKGGKPGKFQLADGGTLFLDEIGDMPMHAQVKILRTIQEGEVEALGSVQSQKVDVRIIAATNQPLEKLIEKNLFREDLYYRINVLQVEVPPLRERIEDIRVLTIYFLEKTSQRIGKRIGKVSAEVQDVLENYSWPGNIRELENVIESAVHLSDGQKITLDDLPQHFKPRTRDNNKAFSLKEMMENTEKNFIEEVLEMTEGDKSLAAERLGIGKSSIYDKVKKYGL
ncbi:sigma 54-interacting transcriptional regulator [Halobacillus yeomjeoni]|uniref:sigma-54 interaction domain-containing protein n=1 Tax=Halobacillus yeomjeoni TaxID=311194 RepID=UPI001CD52DE7|nr:sigma 54-interacting transcriptional regulator [Halobacillus yeomjeoni]MCA0984845.1 sigma 54-interacting transcriptional regulator [Halobacillus yeomjeoni]